MLFTPKDRYTKGLDTRTGFFDREGLEKELREAKANVARLHSKLGRCEQRQGGRSATSLSAMFANPRLAKVSAMAKAVAAAAAKGEAAKAVAAAEPKAATAKAALNLVDVVHR